MDRRFTSPDASKQADLLHQLGDQYAPFEHHLSQWPDWKAKVAPGLHSRSDLFRDIGRPSAPRPVFVQTDDALQLAFPTMRTATGKEVTGAVLSFELAEDATINVWYRPDHVEGEQPREPELLANHAAADFPGVRALVLITRFLERVCADNWMTRAKPRQVTATRDVHVAGL